MRLYPSIFACAALVGLAACDEKPTPGAAASATAPASVETQPPPTASAAEVVIPPPPMPPRPVPLGSSGPIQPSAPADQQMMAISYTLAMVSPRSTDPLVDKAYLEAIIKKLEVAARAADKGKTPASPVKATKGNRKIEVEMGKGCADWVPANLIHQRSGSSLREAYDAGILVISCHDAKWECHQSTRDPKDVLCHAAPRR